MTKNNLISASRQYCVKDVVESDNALGDDGWSLRNLTRLTWVVRQSFSQARGLCGEPPVPRRLQPQPGVVDV